MDLALESLLEVDEKLLELLCRPVLSLGEEQAAIFTLVVNEINHVPVSKCIGQVIGPLISLHMTPPNLSIGAFNSVSIYDRVLRFCLP